MGGELLQILRAEESADALVAEALTRKEEAIAQALKRQEERLANITVPPLPPAPITKRSESTARLDTAARKNMRKAVRVILEAMRVPT